MRTSPCWPPGTYPAGLPARVEKTNCFYCFVAEEINKSSEGFWMSVVKLLYPIRTHSRMTSSQNTTPCLWMNIHVGITKVTRAIQRTFWWPKLKSAYRVLLVSAICARLIKIQIRNHELADSNRKFDWYIHCFNCGTAAHHYRLWCHTGLGVQIK